MIKHGILSLLLGAICFFCTVDGFARHPDATLVFKADNLFLETGGDSLDIGNINQGGNTGIVIRVVNNSSHDFNISNVRGSCRLSVPSWPRTTIGPGEEGFIHFRYDSDRLGPIDRNLTINSNANSPVYILRIVGFVVPSTKIHPGA